MGFGMMRRHRVAKEAKKKEQEVKSEKPVVGGSEEPETTVQVGQELDPEKVAKKVTKKVAKKAKKTKKKVQPKVEEPEGSPEGE